MHDNLADGIHDPSTANAGQALLVIDGRVRRSSAGQFFTSVDPASGNGFADVAEADKADVEEAVDAAQRAFPVWRSTPPAEKGRLLLAVSRAITAERQELAFLESRDTGKPLSQAQTDVDVSARYFEFYAGLADKLLGSTIPLGDAYLDYTVREPLGVSAHIVPWNYPLQIGCRGIAPALAAGNTVVAKPASEASLTLLRLGVLALEAGLPPGALNIVSGPGSTVGAALASSPAINQLTFTGSVGTGVGVMAAAAQIVVPVVLELGGKSPNIVFDDANLDVAIPVVLRAILQNAGQTCSAGSRLLVHRNIADEMTTKLADLMGAVRIGRGVDDPDLGPLISRHQLEHVGEMVTSASRDGAVVAAGGRPAAEAASLGGFFFEPTLLICKGAESITREEVFGPVLAAQVFDDDEEAISLANGTEFGLIAGVWTRDVRRAHVIARAIAAGQIYVNGYGAGGGVELPFGGYRKSGFGREKGIEGINSYLQTKNICISLT
jgi:acyl-CoA reductase-like NAD-dependent aldehyde dehydrogenase